MLEPQIPQKPGMFSLAPDAVPVLPFIKTMPEKYIGAAAGKPPVVRQIVETKVVAPPLPPKPSVPKPPVKKSSKRRNIIVISAIVVIAGIGAAVYILLMPAPKAPVPVINQNTNNQPPITNTPPPPPAPVCGNGVLENGEQCDMGAQNGAPNSGCSATCQTVEVAPPPPPNTGVDSDSDGLTDIEETTVYGTDPYNLDTDHDTFNDGNEVSHLYDPNKKTPALLKNASSVIIVANKEENYSVIVPAKWTTSGENTAQFLANAPSGEFFEVLATDKPSDQSLVEWYLAMSPGTSASDVVRFKTLQGYDALRSPDRLTAYIDPGNGKLFTLTYSYDDKITLEFRTTYEAFLQSFILGLNGPTKP
jgi:cysteine-rich repeat protein